MIRKSIPLFAVCIAVSSGCPSEDTNSDVPDASMTADSGSDATATNASTTDAGEDSGMSSSDAGTDTGQSNNGSNTDAGTDAGGTGGDAGSDADSTADAGGDDTLNTGDTSGDQAVAGEPGSPCTSDGDCTDWSGANDQGAICLTEADDGFPGGYCSFLGDGSTSLNYGCNGFDGIHVPYNSSFGDGYCYHQCDAPNDCRVGYRCVDGACMPDCKDSTCEVGQCDSEKYVCLAP